MLSIAAFMYSFIAAADRRNVVASCDPEPCFVKTVFFSKGLGPKCFDSFFKRFNHAVERVDTYTQELKDLRKKGNFEEIKQSGLQTAYNYYSTRLAQLQDEYGECLRKDPSYKEKIVAVGSRLKLRYSDDSNARPPANASYCNLKNRYDASSSFYDNFYEYDSEVQPEHMYTTLALMKHAQAAIPLTKID